MDNIKKKSQLFKLLDEIEAYQRCVGKVQFDLECCAPEEGMERAGDDMAIVGKHLFKLTHSKKYVRLLTELHENSDGLSPIEKKTVEHLYDFYKKEKNFTPEFAFEMDTVFNRAYSDWLSAKKSGDFSLFKDTLAKSIDITRRAIDLRDDKYSTYYNACLDDYEKGGNEAQLDAFFDALKSRIIPLMRRVIEEGKPIREDFMTRPVPIPQQEAFSRYLLKLEGLRESALVLMTTEHPFTDNFGPGDVRVTTHYFEDNFISNTFSTLHEGGHAIFMQNEPKEIHDAHCSDNMSSAMHETISRFYENIIGRSPEFIHYIYPELMKISGDVFSDVSEQELYEAANIARPSLIRTDADELTYCIHILIRYELEKAFINGDITVDEIPELWNAKYKEYLGIDVPGDSEGCLQDVHWTMSYGYFPSYALGNAYGVQILKTMQKDIDVFAETEKGNLGVIRDWFAEHVFSIASLMTPDEWIRAITGEPLNPDYYLDYLEEKYTRIYGLK